MTHFAQVKDGRVTSVIVADPEFASTADGSWLRTSYNTRGGVHYGIDGTPDGLFALRKNFAAVGDIYDSQRDAFYKPNTLPYHYLDEASCLWKPVLPNKALAMNQSPPLEARKRVYMNAQAQKRLGAVALNNLVCSLGIEVVDDPSLADVALPTDDTQALMLSSSSACAHLAPMSLQAFTNLTDRMAMLSLGIPVLPAYMPTTPEELLALPDEPVFVKRRKTYIQDHSPFAYQEYANPQALLDAADASFWEIQASDNAFVVQPALSHPFQDLDLQIAVNKNSEVLVLSALTLTHEAPKQLGACVPFEGDISAVKAQVQALCTAQGLGAGIHNLQFVQYGGEWCLMDWNARLTGAQAQCFPMAYPVLDDAILHMLGQPLRHAADHLYIEQRSYRHLQLDKTAAVKAMRCGLFPRYDYGAAGEYVARLAGIGENKKEVQDRYSLFESLIA